MVFSAHLAAMDDRVEDRLCDPASYDDGSGTARSVRISIDHPRALDRLSGMSIVRARPTISVRRSACPMLNRGHRFTVAGDVWEACEAPIAEDDGAWWVVEVQRG